MTTENKSVKNIYMPSIVTYATTIVAFIIDQITKAMVIYNMPVNVNINNLLVIPPYPESYKFLPILWFSHVINPGAAFSTFFGRKYLLIIFALVISVAIIFYEIKTAKKRVTTLSLSLGFLLAGAFGNLFDRVRLGYVTDFLDLRWNNHNIWPIFNVADMSINLGIYLLIFYFFFQESKIKKSGDLEDDQIIK